MNNNLLRKSFLSAASLLLVLPLISGNSDGFKPYSEELPGSELIIDMVPIPAGKFMMGSPADEPGRGEDEGPQHEVEISAFWMSTVEITWDQYELFLYRNKDKIPHPNPGNIDMDVDGVSGATMPYVNFNKPGYPLINITQYAASVFCEWLTARTGRFYRLPTEAEWEYACRAGSTEAFSFPLGENLEDYAWYEKNSNGTVNRGGMKKPNAWGLYDMHGNAAEWVLDSYASNGYSQAEGKDPLFQEKKLYPHVVRGGSWQGDESDLRSAARDFSDPSWKKRDPQFPKSLWWHTDALHVGFRIVRPYEIPDQSEWEKYRLPAIKDY